MKKITFAFIVLACGASLPSLQAQTLISGDFTAYSNPQSGAAVFSSSSNSVTPDKWNNFAVNSSSSPFTLSPLVDSSGATTSVGLSATYSGSNTDPEAGAPNGRGTAYDSNTANLMESYIYGNTTVTLFGLSAFTNDTFQLVIYAAGDQSGQGAALSLTGDVSGGNTGSPLGTTGTDRMISKGEGDAYQIFTGTITGDTFTINDSGEINGFQLDIVPEPSTWVAMGLGLGLLGMIQFKRTRLNS